MSTVRPVLVRWVLGALALLWVTVWLWAAIGVRHTDEVEMTRRQQGILTGMPFMANIAPRTFVDDLGRKLYLAKAPTRIVSLAPNVTEILFAIGLDDEIVGVTDFCDYPPAAAQRTKVGYTQPNIEIIITLKPDLVLAPRGFLSADFVGKLEQLKIPTFIIDTESFEGIPNQIQTIGRIVERSPAADRVAQAMRNRVAKIQRTTEGLPPVRVLYVLNSDPLMTVGPGSFIHQVITVAGGMNIARSVSVPYSRLSMEAVLVANPEVIVFPIGKEEGISVAAQQQWRQWTTLSAVQHDRLYQIPADLLNRPGPRILEGLEELARLLHPTVFVRPGGS